VDRVEALGRCAGAAARRADAQDARELEEAQRALPRRPRRGEPAWRVEGEREDVHRPLRRRALRVAEADAHGARRELGARELEEGAQLAGPGHGDIVPPARTRRGAG
jgi:hypothetical protein